MDQTHRNECRKTPTQSLHVRSALHQGGQKAALMKVPYRDDIPVDLVEHRLLGSIGRRRSVHIVLDAAAQEADVGALVVQHLLHDALAVPLAGGRSAGSVGGFVGFVVLLNLLCIHPTQ